MPRLVPRRCVRFVAEFEGFRPTPYRAHPSEIHLTIGYGHYGPDVKPGMRINKRKARKLLRKDLRKYARAVDRDIRVYDRRGKRVSPLNRFQRMALISWTYNVGIGAMQGSTLRRRLNAGENPCKVIREELPRWDKAGGFTVPGLTRRRKAEVRLAGCK